MQISEKNGPQGSNQQHARIVSNNGLASNQCQTIIWSNDDPDYGRIYIYASLGLDKLHVIMCVDAYVVYQMGSKWW